eukprot:TRINITY_DN10315_c0_g1_i2.p2 TRINITY_DN10315_c0_g1~~TRINITY_DN10315_c0_g1_i2.p2  ORF type:complete len:472 (-),score=57.43 TRINITY_DN10315_c0_g1_i2:570-1958(-)
MDKDLEKVLEHNASTTVEQGANKPRLICGRKVKNRKVALVLCYLGAGYQGMQRNPGAKTIEADLEKALYAAGGIPEDSRFKFGKLQWERAARTDKGVSALANVVSLNLLVPRTDPQDMATEINKHLPKQIQITQLVRTAPSFNAKQLCDFRVYEYLIPCWVLDPSSCKSADEFVDILSQRRGKRMEMEKLDEILQEVIGARNEEITQAEPIQIDTHDFDITQSAPDIPATFGQNNSSILSTSNIQKFNQILSKYEGTHNFRNFTQREKADNPATIRFMKCIRVAGLIKFQDEEVWLRIEITGQSFLLYQIRKMMSLAIAIIRQEAPEDAISTALTSMRDLNVPPAPAGTLYLYECNYGSYNKKWEDREALDPVQECKQQIMDFRLKILYPYIYSYCKATKVFGVFCYNLRDSVYGFSNWKKLEGVDEPHSCSKRKQEGSPDSPPKDKKIKTEENKEELKTDD